MSASRHNDGYRALMARCGRRPCHRQMSAEEHGATHPHAASLGRMPGLYDDDFIGYRVATDDEKDVALREAVVAVDANVLLGLYRFLPQTADDVLRVLERLGDRLVVPHQALREFWRHRQRAAGSPEASTRVAEEAISKAAAGAKQALETWSKHVGLDASERAGLLDRVTEFDKALHQELAAMHDRAGARSGDEDLILARLESLLEGRVTEALPVEQWKDVVAEGHRRVEAEEPPGYKDAAKQDTDAPEGAAGDYLVWVQATEHAAERGCDLIIVTADEKDDWWWRQQAALLGPRPELTHEYHRLTGRRLFLLRPPDLLARAAALEIEVDEQSLADADRPADDAAPTEPWTSAALAELLARLDADWPVQAKAIRVAARRSGRVTREQVYELGGYDPDRTLRSFTRPPLRLTADLQAEGIVSDHVLPILVARYPDGVRASHFSVPPEIPAVYAELEPL